MASSHPTSKTGSTRRLTNQKGRKGQGNSKKHVPGTNRSLATLTFRSMEITTENMFMRTKHLFGHVLKDERIRQIYAYARCIPLVGTMNVDKTVFDSQMWRWFDITNTFMLQRMYSVIAGQIHNKRGCIMNVEQYVKLICLFICEDLEMQIKFVFEVYDTIDKGELDKRDYERLLEQVQLEYGSEESEALGPQVLVQLVLAMCDLNGDGKIDLDEFRYLVHGNKLLMQCLGHCLPSKKLIDDFLEMFGDKTTLETSAYFRDERKKALRSADYTSEVQGVQKFYPVPLELP